MRWISDTERDLNVEWGEQEHGHGAEGEAPVGRIVEEEDA
jgi:hypothetical protein